MKKNSMAILLTLIMTFLCACGGSSNYAAQSADSAFSSASYADTESPADWAAEESKPYGADWAETETTSVERESVQFPQGVKMIYRADIEMESTTFDDAANGIAELTESIGGYFEEQSLNNRTSGYRSAGYTIRVPSAQFQSFLSRLGDVCHIRYQTQSAENISEVYYDTSSRLETAKIKLARLQELLSRAEEMEDIITIESAISDTEYQIELLGGELRHYDSLVDYSTVHITLSEVYRVTEESAAPLTFPQRICNSFLNGLHDFASAAEDFAEWLAYSWLTLLLIALLIVLAVRIVRRFKKVGKPVLRFRKKTEEASPADAGDPPSPA